MQIFVQVPWYFRAAVKHSKLGVPYLRVQVHYVPHVFKGPFSRIIDTATVRLCSWPIFYFFLPEYIGVGTRILGFLASCLAQYQVKYLQ